MDEKRRHPRFNFDGAALLVVDSKDGGQTLVLTSYRDVSVGGASLAAPDAILTPGQEVRLAAGESDRGRTAFVVAAGGGKVRLRLSGSDELTEFDLVRLLQNGEPKLED